MGGPTACGGRTRGKREGPTRSTRSPLHRRSTADVESGWEPARLPIPQTGRGTRQRAVCAAYQRCKASAHPASCALVVSWIRCWRTPTRERQVCAFWAALVPWRPTSRSPTRSRRSTTRLRRAHGSCLPASAPKSTGSDQELGRRTGLVSADQSLVRDCWILMLAMVTAWRCDRVTIYRTAAPWRSAGSGSSALRSGHERCSLDLARSGHTQAADPRLPRRSSNSSWRRRWSLVSSSAMGRPSHVGRWDSSASRAFVRRLVCPRSPSAERAG
jgi:hypothetical protein